MTTDTDDLVALAVECGAVITRYEAYTEVRFDGGSILDGFAARLRAAPAAQGAGDERAIWAALEQSERDAYLTLKDRYPDDLAGLCCAGIAELSKVFGQRLAAIAQPVGKPEPTPENWSGCTFINTAAPTIDLSATQAEQAQGVSDAVLVPKAALDWLKKNNPALCEKAGLRALSHSPAPASPPVPQVPEPMTRDEASKVAKEYGIFTVDAKAIIDARDAQWLAALGRQA